MDLKDAINHNTYQHEQDTNRILREMEQQRIREQSAKSNPQPVSNNGSGFLMGTILAKIVDNPKILLWIFLGLVAFALLGQIIMIGFSIVATIAATVSAI